MSIQSEIVQMMNPLQLERTAEKIAEGLPKAEEVGLSLITDLRQELKALSTANATEGATKSGGAVGPECATPVIHHSLKHDVVIEPGGVLGVQSMGGLQAALDFGIKPGRCIGGSVGAGIAAMFTNGMKPLEILEATKSSVYRAQSSPLRWFGDHVGTMMDAMTPGTARSRKAGDIAPWYPWDALKFPTYEQMKVSPSFISLEEPWRREAARLNLKPNNRLVILAEKAGTGEAKVFRGTDDETPLYQQLAGSGSPRGLFMAVDIGKGQLLSDAVYIRRRADSFAERPQAIVFRHHEDEDFRIGPEFRGYDDKPDSIIVHLEKPRVNGFEIHPLDFTTPHLRELWDIGYTKTMATLEQAVEKGRLLLNLPRQIQ